ncbi:MAG TPA: bifunctional phosphoglucose/phosphomannose isomerase [Patescibacteria group bacterium]
MKNISSLDKSNLRQVIIDSPKQFEQGFQLAKDIKIRGDFKTLVVSGMGGSSLPVDVLKIYLKSLYRKNPKKNKPFTVFQNRTYSLPREAYYGGLNFFLSYSGNTEETLESLREAIKNKLPSIGFATGGKVTELCRRNKVPCVMLPKGIEPRYATGYFFASMLRILAQAGMIEDKSQEMIALSKDLWKTVLRLEPKGKKIAKQLVRKTPIIYASSKFGALAMIWKIKINENAKTPAFYNVYPELNHNEMVGFTLPQSKFHIIALLDLNDHPQNIKRMKITAELFRKKGIKTTIVEMENKNIFETIFSTLLLGDWVSYYLALEYKQNPTPVDMVEDLKKQLA